MSKPYDSHGVVDFLGSIRANGLYLSAYRVFAPTHGRASSIQVHYLIDGKVGGVLAESAIDFLGEHLAALRSVLADKSTQPLYEASNYHPSYSLTAQRYEDGDMRIVLSSLDTVLAVLSSPEEITFLQGFLEQTRNPPKPAED